MPTGTEVKDVDLSKDKVAGDTLEQRTIAFARALFERAKKARESTFERMDENLDYYENNGTWKNKAMPSYRAKINDNRCFANVESALPIITDNRPKAEVTANNPQDIEIVRMLKEAYDAKWDDLDLELKSTLAEKYALVYGEGYWKIWFNPLTNSPYGDVDVQVVSPKLIFPDPDSHDPLMKDARYICYHAPVMLNDIIARYPKMAAKLRKAHIEKPVDDEGEGDGDEGGVRGATAIDEGDEQTSTTWNRARDLPNSLKTYITEVWIDDKTLIEHSPDYIVTPADNSAVEMTEELLAKVQASGQEYEIVGAKDLPKLGLEDGTRWVRKYPNGRIIVYCHDVLLRDDPSPYLHGRSPYVRFFRYPVPDKNYFYGEIDMIKPLQDELNKRKSQIVDILQLTANPPIIVNIMSGLDTEKMTNRPGGIWTVNIPVDQAVKWLQTPNIPSALFLQTQQINSDIDTVSGIHDVTQGRKPTGITAGVAIESLQEAAQTRIRLAARFLEYSLKHAAELMLSIIWQYYREPRIIKKRIGNEWEYEEVNFYNVELKGGVPSVAIKSGSTMPVNKSVMRQQAIQLFQVQAIDRRSLLEIFEWPDIEGVLSRLGEGAMPGAEAAQGGAPAGVRLAGG